MKHKVILKSERPLNLSEAIEQKKWIGVESNQNGKVVCKYLLLTEEERGFRNYYLLYNTNNVVTPIPDIGIYGCKTLNSQFHLSVEKCINTLIEDQYNCQLNVVAFDTKPEILEWWATL